MIQKLRFCERLIWLDGRPISFRDREYLQPIYATDGNLVIRASRQVEKSTFVAATIVFEACRNPDSRILFVAPRAEQCHTFSRDRLIPMIQQSPLVRRRLLGHRLRTRITDFEFANGARLYIRPAFLTADACRGISASMLIIDEFQDVAPGHLAVMQETLSHAANPRTILTGTPKLIDNQLEGCFNLSTANIWTIDCPQCRTGVTIDERALGPTGLICPACQSPVDAEQGHWVPRNPLSGWGQGFSISHCMVPWHRGRYDQILERQQTYDPVRFRNEVLGLPASLGDHVVSRSEVEQCCGEARMLRHSEQEAPSEQEALGNRVTLVGAVDWGGGAHSRTIAVLASMRADFTLQIHDVLALHAQEDPNAVLETLTNYFRQHRVSAVAADGNGNGQTYNRMLFGNLQLPGGFYGFFYSSADQDPARDGVLWRWTVSRSASIGSLFARIKRRQIIFPCRGDMEPFIDEFACEIAEYDDQQRAIRYTKPETQRDDAMHATNYAFLLATRGFYGPQW
jgi:hypothetical protein